MQLPKFSQHLHERLQEQRPQLVSRADAVLFYLSLGGLFVFLYDLGFAHSVAAEQVLTYFYGAYMLCMMLVLVLRLFLLNQAGVPRSWILAEYVLLFFAACGVVLAFLPAQTVLPGTLLGRYVEQDLVILAVLLYVFLIELSRRSLDFYRLRYNPALLFIASFILLIVLGTGLLLLPRATTNGISPLDALFTASSAVCVTGLITVDTATAFTTFGKVVILVLIQLGGLGIMTFTSFLALFFQRSSSFQNQLFMQGLINEESIGNTMRTIGNIVWITFLVEFLGACFLYACIGPAEIPRLHDRIGFVLFHSISAFCNAGFSTLSAGLYDPGFRFNYGFQLVIIALILIGGIGFPIIFNLYRYLRATGRNRWQQLYHRERLQYTPRIVNVNTKLVLLTSAVLTVAGTVLYFGMEYNSTLREHSGMGKVVAALFGGVTPRTAGFNTVDMAQLTMPLVLIYLLLMWIGASPGSTGGGIKTTTFALALLNIFSIARGKERLELFGRHIPAKSVQQAFAVMMLSALVIGLAILLIKFFDPDIPLTQVAFETFSAYSTVGLSLGVTGSLSAGSKLVVIVTMFLGRVGTFTLIAGVVTKINDLAYRYPSENIIIT
ncbi:TrkH family potassium uptake protein [Hymenobacter arizonensis]|uniref:Potassium uptake protein, TrkH family n=1 Tax=Hymenobacter arizonensis TaxID=1227077 RepID=A0A1I5WIV5_HYMAR|nr:potassium transporter TrkG [Hymenobacter arizonensis]SFQ19570.1 potassium uptake protein, TrkH family [Hymenobacter arizonensis]